MSTQAMTEKISEYFKTQPVMKNILSLIFFLLPLNTFALDLITDFEWLEPNNRIEIVIGESHQLQYSCSDNNLAFTSAYSDSWVHVDFDGGQHVVNPPTGYSINENGVITGLVSGSYAVHPTSWIQRKSGADKWLYINVVSERSETESNNTFDTANDINSKIRFGLYNISDIDYFKYTNSNLKWGDEVKFKIHFYGSKDYPFGYKWATFCGTEMIGAGSLISQDQECRAFVTSSKTVYLEVYYDQSLSQYFNYGEEFVAEVLINGIPASEYGKDEPEDQKNMINGHEYVDLGLPSGRLWAKTNYGSETDDGYGAYVEWPYRDLVSSVWGEDWSVPSIYDMIELQNNCTYNWTYSSNNVYGVEFTGPNGKSIFLPAAGLSIMGNRNNEGNVAFYWSDTEASSGFACGLSGYAESKTVRTSESFNYSITALPIRPVAPTRDNDKPGIEESHEFVDLALPSGNLWANTNIGAAAESDFGVRFAYGETMEKDKYMEDSYKWLNQATGEYTKYTISGSNPDNKTVLEAEDDAATQKWGEQWRTPTPKDFVELCNYCTSMWEERNGVSGRKFTGANGNSIFLPAAGFVYWYNEYPNELGYYMTNEIESNERFMLFYFNSETCNTTWRNVKYQGYSLRPVSNKSYTSARSISAEKELTDKVYDMRGVRRNGLGKGMNIIRKNDGTTKKIIVK